MPVVPGLVTWAAPDAEQVQTDVARLLSATTPQAKSQAQAALTQALAGSMRSGARSTARSTRPSRRSACTRPRRSCRADGSWIQMPGMNSGLSDTNPTIVAAFKSALLHQGLIVAGLLLLLGLGWLAMREWLPSARAAVGSRRKIAAASRAGRPTAAADRLRHPVDLRRHPPGTARDGRRPAVSGHPAGGGKLARLGAARRELGRHRLVVPPGPGRRRRGLDPDRHRRVADRGAVRLVRPGSPGWPARAGAWWSGSSARRSAGSSRPA